MTSFEERTHTFIVRIWREPREIERAVPEWRGVIEHVPSGERNYLKDLEEILTFMASYLEEMGIRPHRYQRIRSWLNRLKLRCKSCSHKSSAHS